ncbi:MAG TPA: penicillin-binding protein activator [Steroidobacteraceae bacterium]|nr:penicillin-binding protein activator [Steroidobacteraceae bacterium]
MRRTALLAIAAATVLAACTSIGPQSAPVPSMERAEQYAQDGRHEDAARLFEALAATAPGPSAGDLRLRAAREWLAARRPDEAERALAAARSTAGTALAFESRLIEVELKLARGDGQRAWAELGSLSQPAAGPAAARYFEVRERAAFATGRYAEGVRAALAREPFLATAQARRAGRSELLSQLRTAVEHGAKLEPIAERDSIVRGWLELGPIAATAATMPTTAGPAIQRWRSRYPAHPANEVVRSDIEMAGATPQPEQASHIALMLPVSGRLAAAAAQIRDGFFTAYYLSSAGDRPRIRVYDTASLNVADAIARAGDAGATVIVGPLLREEVAGAATYTGARPPVLALNFLGPGETAPAGFYQFALSPENEARSIAERLVSQGLVRGVALVPAGDWGTRVLAAFTEALEAAGGQLAGSATYFPAENDYSAAITQVLRLDASKARLRRLEQVLGTKFAFQPRRRGDAQFIFAPGQPQTARQLRPQLRFHYAGDLPTYSTSDAYEPHATANRDIEGLIFPDMPWVFGVGARTTQVREALRAAWGEDAAARSKLFAFGYDAYLLGLALPAAGTVDIDGLTGRLRFESDRRVRRQLEWARIVNGQPQLLDAAAPAATRP